MCKSVDAEMFSTVLGVTVSMCKNAKVSMSPLVTVSMCQCPRVHEFHVSMCQCADMKMKIRV